MQRIVFNDTNQWGLNGSTMIGENYLSGSRWWQEDCLGKIANGVGKGTSHRKREVAKLTLDKPILNEAPEGSYY
jgi:hypothetical protein